MEVEDLLNDKPPLPRILNLIGQTLGHLTVLQYVGYRESVKKRNCVGRAFYFLCQCDCVDRTTIIIEDNHLKKNKMGCGCYFKKHQKELMTTHGCSRKAEYRIWAGMWSRCSNSKSSNYKYYGEKGISVCDEWHDFEVFYSDVGPRPDKNHTLDRICSDKGYSKSNCRWVMPEVQNNNKTNNLHIIYNGNRVTCTQCARLNNLYVGTLFKRVYAFEKRNPKPDGCFLSTQDGKEFAWIQIK